MTAVKIDRFYGIAPRVAPQKLAVNYSQQANNCHLYSKEIRPLPVPLKIAYPTRPGTQQAIYPLAGQWLSWAKDVDIAPAPLAALNATRIYYTGDYNPKATDTTLAVTGGGTNYPLSFWALGMPAPETAPTVGTAGGVAANITRSYVYTFQSAWGEESAPSLAGTHTGPSDATWSISGMDANPLNAVSITASSYASGVVTFTTNGAHFLSTGRYVTFSAMVGMTDINGLTLEVTRIDPTHFSVVHTTAQAATGGTATRDATVNLTGLTKNLYRSLNGSYYLVQSGITGTSLASDTVSDATLATALLLPTVGWLEPPGDLKGICNLPQGSLAGFTGNTLCLTPPYYPHAWPLAYQFSLPYQIVGIKVFASTIIIATTGRPYIAVVGADPSATSLSRLDVSQSCVSKRSMVLMNSGVVYASPDGLVVVSSVGQPQLFTAQHLTKDDWSSFNPSSMVAGVRDNRYYAFYTGAGTSGTDYGCVILDPLDPEISISTLGVYASGVHTDLSADEMYLVDSGGAVAQWQNVNKSGAQLSFQWRSKMFITPRPLCFKAARVLFTNQDAVTQGNLNTLLLGQIAGVDATKLNGKTPTTGAFAGCACAAYPVAGGPYTESLAGLGSAVSANFSIFADGVLKFQKQLTDNTPFRLTGGYLARQHEVEVSGTNITVHELAVAETMSELAER